MTQPVFDYKYNEFHSLGASFTVEILLSGVILKSGIIGRDRAAGLI